MKPICKTNRNGKYWVIPYTEKHEFSSLGLGILHREDGPAVEQCDGTKFWYVNGHLHKKNGPAIEYQSGDKLWFIKGKYHRKDGPSIEYCNGNISWYSNGKPINPTFEMMEKYIRLNPDNIIKYYRYPLEIQILAIKLKPSVIFNIKYPDPKLKELYPQLFVLKDSGLI